MKCIYPYDFFWLVGTQFEFISMCFRFFFCSDVCPIGASLEAIRQKRAWPRDTIVQPRRDGWVTYLKYFAWLEKFERVLVADTDVTFRGNPDLLLQNLRPNLTFLTVSYSGKERRGMGLGIHSFFHMIRPSDDIFDELVVQSHTGNYTPWTNTEQDVYESRFPPQHYALDSFFWKKQMKYAHSKKRFSCDPTKHVLKWRKTMELEAFCREVVHVCWEMAETVVI